MASRALRSFEQFYRAVSGDIFLFAEELGLQPTHQQKQLFDAVQRNCPRVAVKSGQGPGKTLSTGVVGLWRLMRHKHAKLIVTAPTMAQCKDVWLAQAKKLVHGERANPAFKKMFDFTATGIGVMGMKQSDWGCLLRTASTSEALQGQHETNMDVIVEEASGVDREFIEQFEGTLSNPNALFLQVGNPNSSDCAFYDCFTSDRHRWESFTWNAEETPASAWFNPQRNLDAAKKYGRDSDFYRIRVLGEFPHSDPNCIMSLDDVYGVTGKENAHLRLELARKLYKGRLPKRFGMDFARYGGDENIICRRQGYSILDLNFYPHTDPNDVIDIAFEMQKKALWSNQDTLYVADAGGIGQGVMGNFYRTKHRVHEFHNNGRAKYAKEFEDKISEAWFYLRDLVRDKGVYLPDDSILHKQLSTRQYFLTRKGRICIETKDDYKKRGHDSPDRAEGVIMAMYDYAQSGGRFSQAS